MRTAESVFLLGLCLLVGFVALGLCFGAVSVGESVCVAGFAVVSLIFHEVI